MQQSDASASQRWTVHFAGRVQGVGFRATTQSIARQFTVAGCVRNLDDGRVQLIMEGDPAELAPCLQRIEEAFAGYIRQRLIDRSPATGEFGQPAPGALRIAR